MDTTGAPAQLTWRWRVLARIIIIVVRLLRWRIDVRGLEHVPRRGGAVLAYNHHSYVDFVMVGWPIIRVLHRPLRFLAKREIWTSNKIGWVVRWARAIPVDRSSLRGRAAAFDGAIDALRCGDLVAVAPEQTISPSLELLPFKPGAARMAAAAGVPLVPTISWGSHRFHTVGRRPRWSWRLPVTVRYGEPLFPGLDDDPVEVTEELRRRMAVLLDEVRRDYPDGAPVGAWWVPARLGGGAASPEDTDEFLRRLAEGWHRPTTAMPTPAATEPGLEEVEPAGQPDGQPAGEPDGEEQAS